MVRKWNDEKKPIQEIVENKTPSSIEEMCARAFILNVLEAKPGTPSSASALSALTELLDGKNTPDDIVERAQVLLLDQLSHTTPEGGTRTKSVVQQLPGVVIPGLEEADGQEER
jgi:hypothetical protein